MLIYFALMKIFYISMYILFKCEVLNAQDMTFMDDSDVNKSIIVGPAYVQKIEDYSQMKDYFL
jgi:hypothetical protein